MTAEQAHTPGYDPVSGIRWSSMSKGAEKEATGEVTPLAEREAIAYRTARRRLRLLHTELAGRRKDWAENTQQPCSSARAVAYQSAMQSVGSIIDEIEAIASGVRA